MHRRALLAATLAFGAGAAAAADVVDIRWDGSGAFAHHARVAPGAVLEVCGALAPGQRIAWRFTSAPASDFNIHYHVDKKTVVYPAKLDASAGADGTLAVDAAQDYCWMWTNTGRDAAAVELRVVKAR